MIAIMDIINQTLDRQIVLPVQRENIKIHLDRHRVRYVLPVRIPLHQHLLHVHNALRDIIKEVQERQVVVLVLPVNIRLVEQRVVKHVALGHIQVQDRQVVQNANLVIIKAHLDNQVVNHVQRDQLLLPLDCLRVKVVQRERIKHQLDSRVVLPVPTENIQLQREV